MMRIISIALLASIVAAPAFAEPAKTWEEMTPVERREAIARKVQQVNADPQLRAWMEMKARAALEKLQAKP
jgi:hypothetical protein